MVIMRNKVYMNQNYAKIRKKCLKKSALFEDPLFPANFKSLQVSRSSVPGQIVWKRPKDIAKNPKLVSEKGLSRLSATQGVLGNCWLVASVSVLARVKQLWVKVVPNADDQEFNEKTYAGIFRFCFWQFGQWIEVVIDDRLPTYQQSLIFTHSKDQNEFWCALVEKAYAKLFGSYQALESGNLVDALIDFTGGFAEVIDLMEDQYKHEKNKIELFKYVSKEQTHNSLMCCAIKAPTLQEMEVRTNRGLVKGHAYCITAIKKIKTAGTGLFSFFKGRPKLKMIRLRNPWGEKEWTGAFGDGSPEWKKVSDNERKKLGLTFDDDGEFWMTFDDFCENFTTLSICHLIKTSWLTLGKSWYETLVYGSWKSCKKNPEDDRTGGCPNNTTFLRNPQFRFNVNKNDEEFMMMIQQKDPRARKLDGAIALSIGFQVLKVEINRIYRLHSLRKVETTSDYIQSRNVFHKFKLSYGRYVVIPTSFNPGSEGDFILRVFSNGSTNMRELTRNVPPQPFFPWVKYYIAVTYFNVIKGAVLHIEDNSKAPDTYCVIQWGKFKVASPVCHQSVNPIWDLSAVVYKKNISKSVKFQVWIKGMVKDRLFGEFTFQTLVSSSPVAKSFRLCSADANANANDYVGKIVLESFTTNDFMKV